MLLRAPLVELELDPSLRFMAYFGAAQVEPAGALALEHARKAAAELERMPPTAWQHEALAAWMSEHDRVRPRG